MAVRAHRVVVVANRRARLLTERGPLLEALCRPRPGVRVVETASLVDLDGAAHELAVDPPETVVLAGGDGSYMAGVTALVDAFGSAKLPIIALAPGGTASTVARNWGYEAGGALDFGTRGAAAYAARLVDAAARGEGERVLRSTLRIDDDRGGRRVGFIFGAGLVSRFFEEYEADGAGGYRGALRIVLRIFASSLAGGALARRVLDPVPCAITVDGERAPFDRASLVCASVVRDLGLGMRVPYRAGDCPGRFHAVATPLGPRALGPQLPLVLAGKPLLGDRVDVLASRLAIAFPAGEGAYVVDGELLRADRVEVACGPPVRVLAV